MSSAGMFSGRAAPRMTTRTAYRSAVESVVARMRASADAQLNLAEMAATAGVSRCHFDRLFRAVTSLSPRQFQTALRLHAATRLLLTTDRSVTDVCFDVGYESLGSFVTKFTATFGLPPQRLRQLASAFDQPLARIAPAIQQPPPCPRIIGRVDAPRGVDGIVFVGLFHKRIADEAPAGCAILPRPGPFALASPPDGRYHALAIAVSPSQRAIDILLDDARPRAATTQPVSIWGGAAEVIVLTLRAPEPIDPPVNLILPLLLRFQEMAV